MLVAVRKKLFLPHCVNNNDVLPMTPPSIVPIPPVPIPPPTTITPPITTIHITPCSDSCPDSSFVPQLPWDVVYTIVAYLDVNTLVNFNKAAGTQFSRKLDPSHTDLVFPKAKLPKYYTAFRERESLAPYKARQYVVGEFSLVIPRKEIHALTGITMTTIMYECTLFHFPGNDATSRGCTVWKSFRTLHTGYIYTGSTEEQWTWIYDDYGERFSLSTMRGFRF